MPVRLEMPVSSTGDVEMIQSVAAGMVQTEQLSGVRIWPLHLSSRSVDLLPRTSRSVQAESAARALGLMVCYRPSSH